MLGCCCCNYADQFNRADGSPGSDWTVESGTWAIASNKLRCSTGTGLIVWTTASSRGGPEAIQSASVEVTTANVARTWRLCVGYLDVDNYVALEVTGGNTGSAHIAIVERIAGVETITTGKYRDITFTTSRSEDRNVKITYEPAPDQSYATVSVQIQSSTGSTINLDMELQTAYTGGDQGALEVTAGSGNVDFENFAFPFIKLLVSGECIDYSVDPCGGDSFAQPGVQFGSPVYAGIYEVVGSVKVARWPHNRSELRTRWQLSATTASFNGKYLRAYVDWVDGSNHHYAEVAFATSPSSTSTINVYRVSGGSASLVSGPHVLSGINTPTLRYGLCDDDHEVVFSSTFHGTNTYTFTSTPLGGQYVGYDTNMTSPTTFIEHYGNPDHPIDDGAGCLTCP